MEVSSLQPSPGDHLDSHSPFSCSICLSDSVDPVVTRCGHLFCWSCLYKWIDLQHDTCPVCNSAQVTVSNVIPLYCRGNTKQEEDPRGGVIDTTSINEMLRNRRGRGKSRCGTFDDLSSQPTVSNISNTPPPPPPSSVAASPFHFIFSLLASSLSRHSSQSLSLGSSISNSNININSSNPPIRTHANSGSVTQVEEAQQVYLSRLLLLLGSFVVLCLLLF